MAFLKDSFRVTSADDLLTNRWMIDMSFKGIFDKKAIEKYPELALFAPIFSLQLVDSLNQLTLEIRQNPSDILLLDLNWTGMRANFAGAEWWRQNADIKQDLIICSSQKAELSKHSQLYFTHEEKDKDKLEQREKEKQNLATFVDEGYYKGLVDRNTLPYVAPELLIAYYYGWQYWVDGQHITHYSVSSEAREHKSRTDFNSRKTRNEPLFVSFEHPDNFAKHNEAVKKDLQLV